MKKLLALALALVMVLGVCCAANAESTSYVSWYTFADVFLSSVRSSLDEALTAKGITFVDQDANATQQTQTDQIATAIASNASLLIINQVESGTAGIGQNIVDTVKAANIPLIFFNRAVATDDAEAAQIIKSYDKCVFVGTRQIDAGIMQGQLIGQYVVDHYDEIDLNKDGVISYVMFKGDEANPEAIMRTQYGVEDADKIITAAGKPALSFYDPANTNKYLVDQNGTWSNGASFEYMQTILAQYNEANNNMVELIICNNDDMAFGAVNALTNAGYNTGVEGAKVIPVFGVDATDVAKELINAGRMTGTIKQDNVGMADAIATIAANMLAGKDMFDGLNTAYTVEDGWKVVIPYAIYTGEAK